MADVLELPAPLRDVVTWMMRCDSCALAGIAARLGASESDTRGALAELVERGIVTQIDPVHFRSRPAKRSRRTLPKNLWQALDDVGDTGDPTRAGSDEGGAT